METREHIPVLLRESLESLHLRPGIVVMDGTLGAGGHSSAIYHAVQPGGRVYSYDRDPEAVSYVNKVFPAAEYPGWYRIDGRISVQGCIERPDAALFDAGWSQRQLDAGKGFSFLASDEPLDLRYSTVDAQGVPVITAQAWLNSATEEEISEVLARYGDEPLHHSIARRIAEGRPQGVKELSRIVEQAYRAAYGPVRSRRHPATRTWQALRLFVNHELEALEEDVVAAANILQPSGWLSVITFHSIEDAMIKQLFRFLGGGKSPEDGPPEWTQISGTWGKPSRHMVPSEEELVRNPASRSAKLRFIQKLTN